MLVQDLGSPAGSGCRPLRFASGAHVPELSFCTSAFEIGVCVPGYELEQLGRRALAAKSQVLRESGSLYEAVASAASALASGCTLRGEGVAELVTRAALLPWEGRLVYARAIMAYCPEALLPVLPADFRSDSAPPAPALWSWNQARDPGQAQRCREHLRAQAEAGRIQAMAAAGEAVARHRAVAHMAAVEAHARALRQAAEAHHRALAASLRFR
ncbi:unnamed protein product [Polarella glacialis]|uniref:Uncharacterized protein n=1 Tax=Polarella glacialis TaxID=89957 RepID=A0A813FCU6_POLGL|nr:unnamed protein product [Polarella glacialis]